MSVSLQIGLKQTQKLALTQSLRQSIEMLQLSTIELSELISEELAANPVLEEVISSLPQNPDSTENEIKQRLMGDNSKYENSEKEQINYADVSDTGYSRVFSEDDKKRQFIENSIIDAESLSEHLINQINLLPNEEEIIIILKEIITILDENGFFKFDKEKYAAQKKIDKNKLDDVFEILYNLEPIGCGAFSFQETLLTQARILFPEDEILYKIIDKYFNDLTGLFYNKIACALNISEKEVIIKSQIIKKLNLFPGRAYSRKKAQYIIPDINVKYIDNQLVIIFNDDWVPGLKISNYYQRILNKKGIDKKSLDYIKEKINAAKLFLKNISSRRNTIEKVVHAIMEYQQDFIKKGPGYLKALIHQDIAEKTDFHESTISRVTTNKYVETCWGIFELKYFFSTKLKSENEDNRSTDEALRLIREIVSSEDHDKPFNDEEIVREIARSGIKIARRTIVKYREILGLASSTKRKRLYKIKMEEH